MAAIAAVCVSSAVADERAAAGSLASLVPADVGVCLEARDLAAAVRQFRASDHFERLGQFPPWRRWRDKEGRDLAAVSRQIASIVGVEPGDVWEKVIGHQMLLAIWPGDQPPASAPSGNAPPSNAQAGQAPAVLLVRAAEAESLRKAADGFVKVQADFQRVSWQTANHGGVEYRLGSRSGKRPPMRLAVVGTTAVLSDHERVFHRVLELMQGMGTAGGTRSLAGLTPYVAAAKEMPPGAAITLFVNPAAWEPAIKADVAAAAPAEQPHKEMLLRTWQAVESCWATFELTPRVRLQAAIKYDPQKLPAPVSEFVACFGGPSGFLAKVPEGALLAAAARVDADRFISWAQKHGAPDQQTKGAEADIVVSLLRLLGPDLGVYLKPAEAGDSTQWLQWVGSVAVRPQMPPERESLQLIQAAVQPLLAGMARSFSESASSRLAGFLTGDGLRTLSDSLRLSRAAITGVTLADGRLWVAGTQRALQEAQALASQKSLAGSTRWTSQLGDVARDPSHVLYIDCLAWERLLGRHESALVAATVRERGVDAEAAQRGLTQLRSLLRLADTFVAALKIDGGRIALSLSAAVEPPSSPLPSSPREPASRP